jgi:hypothetical protein
VGGETVIDAEARIRNAELGSQVTRLVAQIEVTR